MKYLSTIPICSNALFIYRLDIKDDLTLKFKEEKFKPIRGRLVFNRRGFKYFKKI